ncbi:unnamed protein product [Prunus armeniaca]
MKSIWVGIKRGTLLATALRAYAADPDLQQEWMMKKKVNKMRLAEYIEAMSGVMVSLDAMFDVHTKQIHEYKKGSGLIYLALSINMTVSRTTLYLLKGAITILQQCAYLVHLLVTLALAVAASSSGFGTGKRPNPPRRPPSRLAPAYLLPSRLATA